MLTFMVAQLVSTIAKYDDINRNTRETSWRMGFRPVADRGDEDSVVAGASVGWFTSLSFDTEIE